MDTRFTSLHHQVLLVYLQDLILLIYSWLLAVVLVEQITELVAVLVV
jgi:hypothetical protein